MNPVLLLTADDTVAWLVAERAESVGVTVTRVATAAAAAPLWDGAPLVLVHDLTAYRRLPRRFGVVVICDAIEAPPPLTPRPLLATHLPDLTELPACLITHAGGVIDVEHTLAAIRSATTFALADPTHPDPAAAGVVLELLLLLDASLTAGHPLPAAWSAAKASRVPQPDLPPGTPATG